MKSAVTGATDNMLGQPQHVKPSYCTVCKTILDGTSCVDDEAKPCPGDITICLYCGNVMAYDDALLLRNLTDDEKNMVAEDKTIQKLLHKIHTNPFFAQNNRH